jgi:hypothetical protein
MSVKMRHLKKLPFTELHAPVDLGARQQRLGCQEGRHLVAHRRHLGGAPDTTGRSSDGIVERGRH